MTPERWEEVKEALAAFLELDRAARPERIAALRQHDPDLADEVADLAGWDDRTGPALEQTPALRPPLSRGSELFGFKIEESIGGGGMAEVYVARRQGEAQGVALKVFTGAPWTPSRRRRFEREARAIGALDHPNVVRMISFHADEFGGAVATELLEGEDLRGRLNRAPLPFDAVLEMAAGIAGGLAAAHHAGIVHRDLKPENVFITEAGAIKLLDFGLAKMVGEKPARGPEDQSATSKPGELMGTPAYMSPEQVRTEGIGPSSDVFAFGSLLYEMLTGRPPFLRDTAIDTMFAVAHESPEPLPAAAAAFSALMDRCLKKPSSERYASGGQLLAALTALR